MIKEHLNKINVFELILSAFFDVKSNIPYVNFIFFVKN